MWIFFCFFHLKCEFMIFMGFLKLWSSLKWDNLKFWIPVRFWVFDFGFDILIWVFGSFPKWSPMRHRRVLRSGQHCFVCALVIAVIGSRGFLSSFADDFSTMAFLWSRRTIFENLAHARIESCGLFVNPVTVKIWDVKTIFAHKIDPENPQNLAPDQIGNAVIFSLASFFLVIVSTYTNRAQRRTDRNQRTANSQHTQT